MNKYGALELADRSWCSECFRSDGFQSSEYNFTNALLWGRVYQQKVLRRDGLFLGRLDHEQLGTRLTYPAGKASVEEKIAVLEETARQAGVPLQILGVTDALREKLEAIYPGRFRYTELPDAADYIYDINKLADLPGKHLHAKRNHIARFCDRYPDWRFEPLTEENLPDCCAMAEEWYKENLERDPSVAEEKPVLQYALDHFRLLRLDGGLIRAGGRVVAFALGDFINTDTYDVHFEKAAEDVDGAYTAINQAFAAHLREKYPQLRYLNREDDLGIPGLRKAKLSYYPDKLAVKFWANLWEDDDDH